MSTGRKIAITGVVLAVILFILPAIPWYVPFALLLLALGIPVAAWAMLDPSQRRRIRANRRRSIGG